MASRIIPVLCVSLVPMVSTAGTICVDLGGGNADALAHGEAAVTWADANPDDDNRCTMAFAAVELQTYLRRMTGDPTDWAVVAPGREGSARQISLGITADPAASETLGPEGYRLRSSRTDPGWHIVITGGGRVGMLYGVYDLLHRLGVRWFAPGGENEEVPSRTLDTIPPLDADERPAFSLRGFHAWENRGNDAFLLWMARNRLNYWCVQQDNHPLLHKLGIHLIGGGHRLTDWYLGPTRTYPYNHAAFTGDDDRPADPYPPSPHVQGHPDGNGRLTYFEAHPEWYALRHGERSDRIRGDGGDNFCTSNPDALREWVRNAVTDLAEGRFKAATLMNAWMLDAGAWCECDACRAQGTPTDRNLRVVHAYAQGIKAAQAAGRITRPIRLLFLAYADVLEPPSKPLPDDFDYDMCIATYFPICRCYVHPIDHAACPRNSRYSNHLQGWAVAPERHYRGQLCIGEYYNVSGYKCLPICFMHTMARDIPHYHSLGARYFHYMHCTTENWGNKALTNWQMARQLWAPDTDCETLWQGYFSGRYGPAADDMRRFYETLEPMLANVTELKYNLARRLDRGAAVLFPGGHLRYERSAETDSEVPSLLDMRAHAAACRRLIDAVLARDLPPRFRHRIAEDERLFSYGEQTLAYYDLAAQAYATARGQQAEQGRELLAKLMTTADLLRADTTSTQHSSSHASAPNAFAATYATSAIAKLETMLGPVAPEDVKAFDPAAEPLVLTHLDLRGGGAQRYTYGFRRYPSRIPISDTGNFVYGHGTGGHDTIHCWFRVPENTAPPAFLTIAGALTPIPGETAIPATVRINDTVLFSGPVPFVEGRVTPYWLNIPEDAVVKGLNRVDIRNTHPHGQLGNRPWIGIDRIEVSADVPADGAPMAPTEEP